MRRIGSSPFFIGVALLVVLSAGASGLAAGEIPALPELRFPQDPGVVRGPGRVAWREYSPERFKEADRDGKLVFLFCTASWSRAGQDMERTVFSDPEIAARLNAQVIAVKVERDARPELDARLK